jgi:hypothetical protein
MFFAVLITCLFFVFLFLAICFIRTWTTPLHPNQKKFLKGNIPNPLPEGFYSGKMTGYTGYWIGKTFDRKNEEGINVFSINGRKIQRFPFITYIEKGLQDRNINVLKIDYNMKENSFFLRMILDEIVEISEGKYLGKVHIRLLPFFPFTLGYFWLNKQ